MGCGRQTEWYLPPVQRPSMREAASDQLGPLVAMSDPNADAYIVHGFRARSEGSWRWALDHPLLRFYLPETGPVKFVMELSLPEQNLQQTGPVTLTLALNGQTFDRIRYDQPGTHEYSHEIPASLVKPNTVNLVAIEPDKTESRPEGGERLGFVLTRAGFVE
jgi:hypothetical protein